MTPTPSDRRVRVLVVDDSPLMREVLTEILRRARDLEVVGCARDAYVALERIETLAPDVITLDVQMPRMDGLSFLALLMRARPTPVVMVSSLTEDGGEITLRALELGAVDFVTKPHLDVRSGTLEHACELIEKVRAAARARVRLPGARRAAYSAGGAAAPVRGPGGITDRVVAIGASTGGTEAIREILEALPADAPGIVIVQHMPPLFTRAFAERLDRSCELRVAEATDGERIREGKALIAPGDRHLTVVRSGSALLARISDAPPVNRHRPSVDLLFQSCAEQVGGSAMGILLTGMGADGADRLAAMRQAGAVTVAQDEASCVVFGMPAEAIRRGAASLVLPPALIAEEILRFTRQPAVGH